MLDIKIPIGLMFFVFGVILRSMDLSPGMIQSCIKNLFPIMSISGWGPGCWLLVVMLLLVEKAVDTGNKQSLNKK